MSDVSQKYLKDADGNIFSPVVSIDSIYNGTGDSLEQIINKLIDDKILADNMKKYPVGKIVMSTENINPSEYLGFGTWKAWGSGRVPVGVNTENSDFNTVEKEGGEQSHSLTINEIPKHSHDFNATTGSNGSHKHSFSATTGGSGSHSHTPGSGSNTAWLGYAQTGTVSRNRINIDSNGSRYFFASTNQSDLVYITGTNNTGNHTHKVSGNTGSTGSHTHTVSGNTGSVGSGQSFSIMPPYITCYMWKRIS